MNYFMYSVEKEAYRLIKKEAEKHGGEMVRAELVLNSKKFPEGYLNREGLPAMFCVFEDPKGMEEPILLIKTWDGRKSYRILDNKDDFDEEALRLMHANGFWYYREELNNFVDKKLGRRPAVGFNPNANDSKQSMSATITKI